MAPPATSGRCTAYVCSSCCTPAGTTAVTASAVYCTPGCGEGPAGPSARRLKLRGGGARRGREPSRLRCLQQGPGSKAAAAARQQLRAPRPCRRPLQPACCPSTHLSAAANARQCTHGPVEEAGGFSASAAMRASAGSARWGEAAARCMSQARRRHASSGLQSGGGRGSWQSPAVLQRCCPTAHCCGGRAAALWAAERWRQRELPSPAAAWPDSSSQLRCWGASDERQRLAAAAARTWSDVDGGDGRAAVGPSTLAGARRHPRARPRQPAPHSEEPPTGQGEPREAV